MTIFDNYAARYERTREEEFSLSEYLALCKKDPLTYATAPERMLAAIGEPTLVDTRNDTRLSRIFANKVIKLYPAFRDFYGTEEVIEQVVSYFRHAAQGLEERKQILYLLGPVGGGKSSIAEKLKSLMELVPFYCLKGSPVNGIAARPVQRRGRRHHSSKKTTASRGATCAPSRAPWAVKRLHEFNGRHQQVPGGQALPVDAQADRDLQDRAGRREQPGHFLAGRQGRYPQARGLCPGRSGRLQLLGRPVPGQPGPDGIRRDVQGADQGAAPALDRHPGRQLQGHRRLRRDPVRRHRAGPLQRIGVEDLPQQPQQRGFPRPHLHRQGAVLPARVRRDQDLRQADPATPRSSTPRARRER